MEEAVQEAEDPGLVTKYGSSCDELRWSELFNCLLETVRLAPAPIKQNSPQRPTLGGLAKAPRPERQVTEAIVSAFAC